MKNEIKVIWTMDIDNADVEDYLLNDFTVAMLVINDLSVAICRKIMQWQTDYNASELSSANYGVGCRATAKGYHYHILQRITFSNEQDKTQFIASFSEATRLNADENDLLLSKNYAICHIIDD